MLKVRLSNKILLQDNIVFPLSHKTHNYLLQWKNILRPIPGKPKELKLL